MAPGAFACYPLPHDESERPGPGVSKHAEGSCFARFGDTHVLCTASIDEKVPPHVFGTGAGWVTAEYWNVAPLNA